MRRHKAINADILNYNSRVIKSIEITFLLYRWFSFQLFIHSTKCSFFQFYFYNIQGVFRSATFSSYWKAIYYSNKYANVRIILLKGGQFRIIFVKINFILRCLKLIKWNKFIQWRSYGFLNFYMLDWCHNVKVCWEV